MLHHRIPAAHENLGEKVVVFAPLKQWAPNHVSPIHHKGGHRRGMPIGCLLRPAGWLASLFSPDKAQSQQVEMSHVDRTIWLQQITY